MALDRPIWAIKAALAEDKKEYLRILKSHDRHVGKYEQNALDLLTNRMKECEDALTIIEEFAFNPTPGS